MRNNNTKRIVAWFLFALFGVFFLLTLIWINKKQEIQNKSESESLKEVFSKEEIFPIGDEKLENFQQQKIVNPIENALERITKKPFGIFISPKTSPVQPERFGGYHTGIDLETMPEEQNIDVPVRILCDGKLLMARQADGYGGVAVQGCNLNGQVVTVVYGHLDLPSVSAKVGTEVKTGDFLANLGEGYSLQTDGERKHLHLGIHKGNNVNILGYVKSHSALSKWLDPAKFLQ